jgi:hypothetical protein
MTSASRVTWAAIFFAGFAVGLLGGHWLEHAQHHITSDDQKCGP